MANKDQKVTKEKKKPKSDKVKKGEKKPKKTYE